jgi:16S rRNA (guanine1207-N2)-methyltransferase
VGGETSDEVVRVASVKRPVRTTEEVHVEGHAAIIVTVMEPNLRVERVRGYELRLLTLSGVFAAGGLDPGTRLLIESMRVSPTARVLDLGCGGGAIGIVAAKLAERGSAVLVDCDVRATRLTQRNLELNGVANASVVLGDSVHDLPAKSRFDVVVSNPPTHSGRDVLDDFVAGAYAVLKPRGRLYIVVNRLLSLRREVERVFGNVETVARQRGYIVVTATKLPRERED